MLIRFVISNFLSFNEETEFNMLAGSFRTHKHHVYKANKLNILKGTALYGANGAGKSNFVKAIDYFKNIVKNGKLNKSVNSKKFKLGKTNIDKPVEFEIEFNYKRKIYAYGISINGSIIEKEWLYLSGIDKKDKLIFERKTNKNGKSSIKIAGKYQKTQKEKQLIELIEENILKSNEFFLGKSEILKITDINNVVEWITESLIIIYPDEKFDGIFLLHLKTEKFNSFTNRILHSFDTGVNKLIVEEIDFDIFFGKNNMILKKKYLDALESKDSIFHKTKNETILFTKENGKLLVKKIVAIHNDQNNNKISFNLSEESDGTQRLIDFIPAFHIILNSDTTFIIDEIDQSLHPSLLHTLVKKIMDNETTKGQLIFTTHEANLLDLNIFRQDEIWFAEKNKSGATQLYSLSDYKPRYDLDIRKGYLKGRFGAIPFLGDLKKLNWQKDDA